MTNFNLSERSKQIRRDSLKLGLPNGIYHWGGSFSVVEILIALYDHVLKPEDKVIMSKGHCWIPQIVLLREKGLNPGFGPRLDNPDQQCLVGHPFLDETNGIYANTGSLGHGLPIGVGRALGMKMNGSPGRVYVIVGDGEIQEGTTWESILLAAKLKLDNLIVIIDSNLIQGSGRVSDIHPQCVGAIMQAASGAGWHAWDCDGQTVDDLVETLHIPHDMPKMIAAYTEKGYPISFMMNKPEWHAKYPNEQELAQIYKELE